MKEMNIPRWLHELFGERPTQVSVLAVLFFGGIATLLYAVRFPELFDKAAGWRSLVLLLLIFDIFCGVLANFTKSTNDYYVRHAGRRLIFISIHVHIVVITFLLQTNIWQAFTVWLYTIAAALVVNSRITHTSQPLIGGFFLCTGLLAIPLLPGLELYTLVLFQFFMAKIVYSFAVDHYRKRDTA